VDSSLTKVADRPVAGVRLLRFAVRERTFGLMSGGDFLLPNWPHSGKPATRCHDGTTLGGITFPNDERGRIIGQAPASASEGRMATRNGWRDRENSQVSSR